MRAQLYFLLLITSIFPLTSTAQTVFTCQSNTNSSVTLTTDEAAVLDAVTTSLFGANVDLTTSEWNQLSGTRFSVSAFVNALAAQAGLQSPDDVFNQPYSVSVILGELASVVADPASSVIADLANDPLISALTGTLDGSDLLDLELPVESTAPLSLDLLNALISIAASYNSEELTGLPLAATVAVSIPDVTQIELRIKSGQERMAQCNAEGEMSFSSSNRIALALTLADVDLGSATVPGVIDPAQVTLSRLDLFTATAPGMSVVDLVDVINGMVRNQVTPSVSDTYLGAIDPALFFDPQQPINPAVDLQPGVVGSVSLGVIGLGSFDAALLIRSAATGAAPAAELLTFNGPFPESQSADAGAVGWATIASSLITNSELTLDISLLPGPVQTVINGVLATLIDGIRVLFNDVDDDYIAPALTQVVEPTQSQSGVNNGEMAVTSESIAIDDQSDGDGDGIPDVYERDGDTDMDGDPDVADADDDGDNLPTLFECPNGLPCPDSDGDGLPDYLDRDDDNDGVNTDDECPAGPPCPDSDMDGIPDHIDPTNNDANGDADQDGLTDAEECPGGDPCRDSDGDGIPDFQDADDDNDGIPTTTECPSGTPCPDTDNDGIPDYIDPSNDDAGGDADGDGIPDTDECPAGVPCPDSDQDTIPDYADGDDDGDGVITLRELPATLDTDGNGTANYLDSDDDGDTVGTRIECPLGYDCPDSDGDGIPDYLDATNNDASTDSDGDGISDANECYGNINVCPDTDGDGRPDYRDGDDDGDGTTTLTECPTGVPCVDNDGDDIPDYLDPNPSGDPGGDGDQDGLPDTSECPGGIPCRDTDGDGIPNYTDPDDDNDGIPTIDECPTGDPCDDDDSDDIPNHEDPNDGSGDADNDGISDGVECPMGTACPDTDLDLTPDYFDPEDDADGLLTRDECPLGVPCPDLDNDLIPGYLDDDEPGLMPQAVDDVFTVFIPGSGTLDVTSNDLRNANNDRLFLVAADQVSTFGADVVIDDRGTSNPLDDRIIYTLISPLRQGMDDFSYTIRDTSGRTSTAIVIVNTVAEPEIFSDSFED